MRKGILCLFVSICIIFSTLISWSNITAKAETGIPEDIAQQFVELFYDANSEIANDVERLLTEDDTEKTDVLESVNSKIALFFSTISKSNVTSSQLIKDISYTTNGAKNIVSFVNNVKDATKSNDSFKKSTKSLSAICDALTMLGVSVPSTISFSLSAVNMSVELSELLQIKYLQLAKNDYQTALEFQLLDGNTNFITPEYFQEKCVYGRVWGDNKTIFDSMLNLVYWEYEFKYNSEKYMEKYSSSSTPSSTINGAISNGNSTYQITFDSNCSDVNDYTYTYYSAQDNWHVPTMTRFGYIFCGWFYDSACTQSAAGTITLNSDKTFYAKWQKRNAVITLNSNCSYVPNKTIDIDLLYGENTTIPSLTRNGYIFGGWYLESTCTNKVSSSLAIKNDLVLYAKWHPQFTFTNNNGSITITGVANYIAENGKPNGDITIPAHIDGNSVTEIGTRSFIDNLNITSVKIPNSVKKINYRAFHGCTNLKDIYIGNGIIEIADCAFIECINIKNVYVTDINAWCNIHFGLDANPLSRGSKLYVNGSLLENLDTSINKISNLNSRCFYNYDYLKSVAVSSDVKNIGELAFGWCENLEKVVFADGLTDIGDAAFENCNKLKQVVLPQTLTKISYGLFCFCENLKEIQIPYNVTEIGDTAFHHCASLETITFPQNLEKIGERAFEMCHNIQQINFNDGLKEIGEGAFASCFSLESVELPGTLKVLPRDLFIMDHSLCNCDIRHLSSLKNVVLKEGIEKIGYGSFMMCRNLTSISLPNSLKTIGYSAFTYCKALKTIDLPESLQTISGQAFSGCESLEGLYIPKNVATIGPRALMNCDSLSYIEVDKDNTAFMCENGVLYDKDKTRLLRCYDMNNKMYKLPNTIRYIEKYAFQTCENTNKIIISDGIDNIPETAFSECKNLKTIVIPKSVTKIEAYALSNTSLEKIYYEGTKDDWNKVTIDASAGENYCNYFILGIPKYYNCIYSSEQTQICDDKNTITACIEPTENYINNKVIFALYKASTITSIEIQDFTDLQKPLEFSSNKEYDMAKIMIWENMDNIVPQCPVEIITK